MDNNTGTVDAEVTEDNGSGDSADSGDGGGSDGSEEEDRWNWLQCDGWRAWEPGLTAGLGASEGQTVDDDGVVTNWHPVICFDNGVPGYSWDSWPVEVVDLGVVARQTRDRLLTELQARVVAPVPVIAMSPPVGHFQLVGLWGWFWVEPESYESQADTAGDPAELSITLTAVPGELRFYPGDDDVTGVATVVTCEGPGLEWQRGLDDDATDCRHFWDWPSKWDPSGQFTTRAEADYEFTWEATGRLAAFLPSAVGTLGVVPVDSELTPVTVIEVQAVIG